MTRKLLLTYFLLISAALSDGQEIITYLQQVKENNPEIIACRKLLEARKEEALTGIAPAGPSFSFGYMPEITDKTAVKKTWAVSQSFSFPSRYLFQKKLNRNTVILAEHEFNLGVLNILLDAKLTFLDFISLQKSLDMLTTRKALVDRIKISIETMLKIGETTILNHNKLLIELSVLNLRISRTLADISILREKLTFMGGQNFEIPSVLDYPVAPETDPGKLIAEKIKLHPAFLIPEAEYQISLQEVKLSRTGSLPEFHAGYASEIMPGEAFSGPVAGISIPLWSNAKKTKTAVAYASHAAASRDSELMRLKSHVKNEYENMLALQKSLSEISALDQIDREGASIEKAFESGEISLTDYFIYLESAYGVKDKLNEIENEYYKSKARLADHELIW